MPALEQDSQRRIHLLKQTSPREFPLTAQPLAMTSLNLKRQRPDQARTNHRPVGFNAQAWGALLRHFETFSGDMAPDYRQIVPILNMVFGEAVETVVPVTVGATTFQVKRREWVFPESLLPALVQYAMENGYPRAAKRMVYGLCPAFGINVKRGNAPSISGSATLMFSKPQKNLDGSENFVMTGAAAQNAGFQISATGATGPGVFSVKVGNAAPANVTFAIGDTTAQTTTKLAAVGLTATVAGTVAIAAGEKHTVSGTGSALTAYGIDVFSKTIATLQTAIRALDAAHSTAVVTGTITAGSGAGYTVSGAGTAEANGVYEEGPLFQTRPAWYKGATHRISTTSAGNVQISDVVANVLLYASVASGLTTPPATPAEWTSQTGAAPAPTVTAKVATVGSANLTVSYDAAAGNIPDLVFVGAGYAGASIQPGAAGGNISATVTAPINTPVVIARVSGDGWASLLTQSGGDGSLRVPQQFPLLPQHFALRTATRLVDLNAATPLLGVHETDLQLSNVVEPDMVFAEGDLGYQNHVGGDIEVKHKVVFVSDELNPNSQVQKYRDDADAAPARALWHQNKATHSDKLHSLLYEGKFAAGDAYTPSAGGKVFQYEFDQTLELNDELTTPTGEPGILRFVQTEPV